MDYSLATLEPGTLYVLPLVIFGAYMLLFFPSMAVDGKPKAHEVGMAITCYFMKTMGLFLMGAGLIPLLYNIIGQTILPMPAVLSLVLLLAVGMGLVTYYSQIANGLPDAARLVPRTVFNHAFEVIGIMTVILSGISLGVMCLLTHDYSGWQLHAALFMLGLLLAVSFSIQIQVQHREGRNGGRKKR